jgi:hypothetical protein
VTVAAIVLARLLRRRRTLCANFVVADTALHLEREQDLFSASQIVHLKPLIGEATYRRFLEANPVVRRYYPNVDGAEPGTPRIHQGTVLRAAKRVAERVLAWPAAGVERICRTLYRAYLLRRAPTWQSPDQVRLDDDLLKLHTHSHRHRVLGRYGEQQGRAGVR